MVDISRFLIPHRFEHGLRLLEKGYSATREALMSEAETIKKEAHAYEEAIARDPSKRIEVCDDEGHLLWEQSQIFDLKISEAHEALFEARKSFIVSAYHHWECCATDLRGSGGTHEQLVETCTEAGYGPCAEINAVRYLVNHIKHGPNSNTNWIQKLHKKFPEFLSIRENVQLELSETDINKVSAAIFATGPYQTSNITL